MITDFAKINEGNAFINCDCLEGMEYIADNSVDMILTDPPYGTTQNKWDSVIPLDSLWTHYKRILKSGGVVAICSQMPFTVDVVQSNREWFRYEWIWEKHRGTGFLNANRMPLKIHENILIFYETLPTYNPQKRQGFRPGERVNIPPSNTKCYGEFDKHSWKSDGTRYPIDIIRFSNQNKLGNINQTQKPIRLMEYLILTYTNKGELVFDSCAGSASTLIAANNLGRRFIGMEKDKEMYERALKRLKTETAQINLFQKEAL